MADNPKFYCTPTSGLADLVLNSKFAFNNSQAFKSQELKKMQPHLLNYIKGGMSNFFNEITNAEYVLDKSRDWAIHYNLLKELFENPKIICMVRDPRAIYASMEKNFRKNSVIDSYIQNPQQLVGTTLDKRIDIWADGIPVGIAMERIKDCFQQGIAEKMLFIRYEDLMSYPENELRKVYNYLEIPYYEGHQFEIVTQHTNENDTIHGVFGDHKLRSKFEKLPDDFEDVLGYEICEKIKNTYRDFYTTFGYI